MRLGWYVITLQDAGNLTPQALSLFMHEAGGTRVCRPPPPLLPVLTFRSPSHPTRISTSLQQTWTKEVSRFSLSLSFGLKWCCSEPSNKTILKKNELPIKFSLSMWPETVIRIRSDYLPKLSNIFHKLNITETRCVILIYTILFPPFWKKSYIAWKKNSG